MASVLPCVGRTAPEESGIQSICCLKSPVLMHSRSAKTLIRALRPEESAYQVAVLLGADPNMAVAPFAQLAQLLNLGMRMLHVVFLRQAGWVIHPNIAP